MKGVSSLLGRVFSFRKTAAPILSCHRPQSQSHSIGNITPVKTSLEEEAEIIRVLLNEGLIYKEAARKAVVSQSKARYAWTAMILCPLRYRAITSLHRQAVISVFGLMLLLLVAELSGIELLFVVCE